jgi:hypothetical protein
MMGYVAGPVYTNVRAWWVAVHDNFGIGVSTAAESSFHPLPTRRRPMNM